MTVIIPRIRSAIEITDGGERLMISAESGVQDDAHIGLTLTRPTGDPIGTVWVTPAELAMMPAILMSIRDELKVARAKLATAGVA